ncbi:ATP-binding cassette domain-containing protein [Zophobihabitans entericus]|uniref:ABC-F family ATP-binding cassette domain-containing protein n=1 Tax=Zophobihabitans entericus TaxID=1635327 RepID=A0A6G9IBY5_9GAMM|nr:ATP-binding cassette domain-containing protein [Zophobihabitans entericus]QIQ21723.1 ABC-F family ATP-binding cassette domain-containing protein [Zophobihabitans entericus]
MHSPIAINDLGLSFPHKTCFSHFSTTIYSGQKIAIIGDNGSGKSTLLTLLSHSHSANNIVHDGQISLPDNVIVGYLPQFFDNDKQLSGGQALNKQLSQVLAKHPNILLLDEPTNHLDHKNRKSLFALLERYQGTLLVVTHDPELITRCTTELWHINNQKITQFSGSYENYLSVNQQLKESIASQQRQLQQQQKELHNKRMQEQKRTARSKSKGLKSIQDKKWSPIVGHMKSSYAQENTGKKQKLIAEQKDKLQQQMSSLYLPKMLSPTFQLNPKIIKNSLVIEIRDGSLGYTKDSPLLNHLNLRCYSGDRLVIQGNNGSGKTTLLRAIYGDNTLFKTGSWHLPEPKDIGYLQQNYPELDLHLTVQQELEKSAPDWNEQQIRQHLNTFLFYKHEALNQTVETLSGGEKVRLSLAKITANPPVLLLLDEITNNIDLTTKEYLIQVLSGYTGTMILVSHDVLFLQQIGITAEFSLEALNAELINRNKNMRV